MYMKIVDQKPTGIFSEQPEPDGEWLPYIPGKFGQFNPDIQKLHRFIVDGVVREALVGEPEAEYRILRRSEYPPVEEQLDLIFHQGVAQWEAAIQAVKDKYPKPQS